MTTTTYKLLMERIFTEGPRLSSRPESQAHKQAQEMGLKHLGGGYYGKDDGKGATHKIENNRIIPLPPEEKKAYQQRTGIRATPGTPKSQLAKAANLPRVPIKTATGQEYTKDQFSQAIAARKAESLSKFNKSPNLKAIESEFLPDFHRFYGRLDRLNKLPPGKKRRDELEDLIITFGMMLGNNKIYANHFTARGGLYKVFGNTLPKEAQYFLDMVASEGINMPTSTTNADSAKHYLTAQSKPNYGKPHRIDDPHVEELFSSDPGLDALEPRYKAVYGPTDSNGQLLQSGGKNAKEYFNHSVNANKSISNTIEALEAMGSSNSEHQGFIGIAEALRNYQSNMQKVNKAFDSFTPKARAELVGQIYAKLAHDMHVADTNTASAIMKNVAEQALYDTEIAGGQEVYLPSDGNFPSGDKIVVTRKGTKVEKIEAISVKYGKNSDHSYGMPGEAAKFCLYHPDVKFRDIIDSRAGRTGYETGVNGTIIHDEANFRLFAKLSSLDKCFKKADLEKIRELGVQMTLVTKKFKKNHPKNKNGELPGGELGGVENEPAMQNLWKQLYNTLQKGNQQQLDEILGTHNHRQIMHPNKRSMAFYSLMAFGAALHTSHGFPTILHNHQEYKNGQFISTTDEGTDQLRDWQVKWTPYGDRAGGLKVGFNKQGNKS